jgi:hypothetical protein
MIPHANLIRAMLDGSTIQYNDPAHGWMDLEPQGFFHHLAEPRPDAQYRVKLGEWDEVLELNVVLYANGKDKPAHRCEHCHANVFSKMAKSHTPGWTRYRCNGCGDELEGQ